MNQSISHRSPIRKKELTIPNNSNLGSRSSRKQEHYHRATVHKANPFKTKNRFFWLQAQCFGKSKTVPQAV